MFTCQNCWGHFQGFLNADGLCKSCISQQHSKRLSDEMAHKLSANRMTNDSSDLHNAVQRVFNEILNDILNTNPTLNKAVLQLIIGYIGNFRFLRDIICNDHRYRLFNEFIVNNTRCAVDECDAFYAVQVVPADVPFVLQNVINAPNTALYRKVQSEDGDSAMELFQRLFLSQNERDFVSWSAPENGGYAQNESHRSYLLTKPNRAFTPMYGVMHFTIIPNNGL